MNYIYVFLARSKIVYSDIHSLNLSFKLFGLNFIFISALVYIRTLMHQIKPYIGAIIFYIVIKCWASIAT